MELDLSGKRVLVTGSTGGVGLEIASQFVDAGASVVINGRNEDEGAAVAATLDEGPEDVQFISADLTSYEQIESMVDQVVDSLGGLDILVVSGAATAAPPPDFFTETAPEDLPAFLGPMYLSRVYTAKAALDPLIDAEDARIVFISADAGRWPTPAEIGPGSAGAAVMMATKVLASELGRYGVSVNTVSLSVTEDTPAYEWTLEESPASNVFQKATERQSFTVRASDVAETVLFLAGSDGARPITGQLLSVNGGVSFPG